jgi:hypothetical protein
MFAVEQKKTATNFLELRHGNDFLGRNEIPNLDHAIARAGSGPATIGRDAAGQNPILMARQRRQGPRPIQVPGQKHAVVGPGQKRSPVGGEKATGDNIVMAVKRAPFSLPGRIPDDDGAVPGRSGQGPAIHAENNGGYRSRMSEERGDLLMRKGIPARQHPFQGPRKPLLAIWRNRAG